MQSERLRILNLLAAGKLTAEQAEQLLQALDGAEDEPRSPAGEAAPAMPARPHWLERLRRFWALPTLLGAALMGLALVGVSGSGFWVVVCLRLPVLVLGLLSGLFGLSLRTSTWVHVRVLQPPGEWPRRITVALPLPLRTFIVLVRLFGWLLPLEAAALERLLRALGEIRADGTPLRVEVQDADGELVEVFVG